MTTNFPTAKDCIIEAFLQLCLTIPCDQITVSQLTKKAGYNRSTFYAHFKNTDDLLRHLEAKFFNTLGIFLPLALRIIITGNAAAEERRLFKLFFQNNIRAFSILLGKNGDPRFAHKIKRSLRQAILQYLNLTEAQLTPQTDMLLEFIISGHLQVLVYCGERPDSLSPLDFLLRMSNSIDREKFLAAMTSKPDKSF